VIWITENHDKLYFGALMRGALLIDAVYYSHNNAFFCLPLFFVSSVATIGRHMNVGTGLKPKRCAAVCHCAGVFGGRGVHAGTRSTNFSASALCPKIGAKTPSTTSRAMLSSCSVGRNPRCMAASPTSCVSAFDAELCSWRTVQSAALFARRTEVANKPVVRDSYRVGFVKPSKFLVERPRSLPMLSCSLLKVR
jgi:hypothetical protein